MGVRRGAASPHEVRSGGVIRRRSICCRWRHVDCGSGSLSGPALSRPAFATRRPIRARLNLGFVGLAFAVMGAGVVMGLGIATGTPAGWVLAGLVVGPALVVISGELGLYAIAGWAVLEGV